MRSPLFAALLCALLLTLPACKKGADPSAPLKLGFFPNLTHAQALVGQADGSFERALEGKPLSLQKFNAGPAAMEALLGGSLDVAYVGAGPAINAFIKSEGALRVIAGAASGGAVLVTKEVRTAEGLRGKKLAAPQLGNTQDIALRHWLGEHGYEVKLGQAGGAVTVLSLSNSDILGLYRRGDLEGAWVPEPWGARLLAEGGGAILVDERTLWPAGEFPTTVLVASQAALSRRPEDVKAILRAHVALTERYARDPAAFAQAANRAFGALTQHPLPPAVLADAFSRLRLTTDPMGPQLATLAEHAKGLGYLQTADVSGLVAEQPLREVSGEAPPSPRAPD